MMTSPLKTNRLSDEDITRLKQEVRAAEKLLDDIHAVHKQNVSNGSIDLDEFDRLHEKALHNLVMLKQVQKKAT